MLTTHRKNCIHKKGKDFVAENDLRKMISKGAQRTIRGGLMNARYNFIKNGYRIAQQKNGVFEKKMSN
jgi:hypothetical protein